MRSEKNKSNTSNNIVAAELNRSVKRNGSGHSAKYRRLQAAALLLSVLVFSGCGSGSDEQGQTEIPVTTSPKVIETAAPTAAPKETTATKKIPTIEKTCLYDGSGVTVTATEYTVDRYGDTIKVSIENKSDIDVYVACKSVVVNDFMDIAAIYDETVAAGETVNTDIHIFESELSAAKITNVGKIETHFRLTDAKSYHEIGDVQYAEIRTSEYSNMDGISNAQGAVLYDENEIKFVITDIQSTSMGMKLCMYAENNSADNIIVKISDVYINECAVDGYYNCFLYSGKKSTQSLEVFNSVLKEVGISDIDDIERIEIKFRVINDNPYVDIFESDLVDVPLIFGGNTPSSGSASNHSAPQK